MNRIHRPPGDIGCEQARELLSARLDRELRESAPLDAHLASCEHCRAHERALASLTRELAGLREPAPVTDLWERIERRARPRPPVQVLARVAAALVGFVGLGGTALLVERDRAPGPRERHLLERLDPDEPRPDALFASLPEYRLLRALPRGEESR